MAPRPRKPSVLAYNAVADADTTADAKRVYTAMKAARCHAADLCVMDEACPFLVDCMAVEGNSDDGG
jgi:hypothetical protein